MKTSLIILLFCITQIAFSQTQEKGHKYGISFGIGNSDVLRKALDGGPSFDGLASYDVGFSYDHLLMKQLYLETGLHANFTKIEVTPNFYPGMDMTPKSYNMGLLYIPVNLRLEFMKYWFINGGLLANMDLSTNSGISSQTGFGADLGFGVKIPVFNYCRIYINPYLAFRGMALFSADTYPTRLIDSGVKIVVR